MSADDPLLDRTAIEEAFRRLAARRRDAEDIRFLVKHLGLTSSEQVLTLCMEIFPEEEVPGRARLVLDDVFDGR
ncbi:hypothetical protein ACH4T9_21310 [Micromonospora sp. NPDC020750]|uniref:hypothetical protein n=1 Tax=unclassified Micromonospora TaxID=2617518 RepID=UPI00378DA4D3